MGRIGRTVSGLRLLKVLMWPTSRTPHGIEAGGIAGQGRAGRCTAGLGGGWGGSFPLGWHVCTFLVSGSLSC